MFVVIFEVEPKKARFDEYLSLGKFLKPQLEKIDGFIDNERFVSQSSQGRILSLSTWRDEKAVIRWRTLPVHHKVQQKGRNEIFETYRLRVGEVIADSELPKGHALRDQRLDETEVGDAKCTTISELSPGAGAGPSAADLAAQLELPEAGTNGVVGREVFESIYKPGKLLLFGTWRDAAGAERWTPRAPASGTLRHRRVRIIRDYGLDDRREAPQYYPPVPRRAASLPGSAASPRLGVVITAQRDLDQQIREAQVAPSISNANPRANRSDVPRRPLSAHLPGRRVEAVP